MTSPIEVEACILGAGPVGATLAALLAAGGVRAAVVDAAPLPPCARAAGPPYLEGPLRPPRSRA